MAKRPRCTAKTKAGKRCSRYAMEGGETCIAHAQRNQKVSRGFGGPQEGSGRPRRPHIVEVLRERIEADIERWLAPLEAALAAGKPVVMWDGEERKHHIEYVPDPALGMKALKLALDRVYGRPLQEVELSGGIENQVRLTDETFADPELREALHDVVCRVADARARKSGGPGAGD